MVLHLPGWLMPVAPAIADLSFETSVGHMPRPACPHAAFASPLGTAILRALLLTSESRLILLRRFMAGSSLFRCMFALLCPLMLSCSPRSLPSAATCTCTPSARR